MTVRLSPSSATHPRVAGRAGVQDVLTTQPASKANLQPFLTQLDGRIATGAVPATLPVSGGVPGASLPVTVLLGTFLLALGLFVRRRVPE